MRFLRAIVCVVAAVSLLSAVPAEAATPSKGTLSKSKMKLSWTGTFVASNPASNCDIPTCDHFALKVNMGEGGMVKVFLPPLDVPGDMDIYIFDASGREVGSGTSFMEGETVAWKHKKKFRNKAYDVRVVPYLVAPGTMYKATAQITKFVK